MPPRFARGRSSATSPRAQAVGTQGGKKSLQARFFVAASPAASALAGFPPAPSRSQVVRAEPFKSKMESGKRKMKELALLRSTCVGKAGGILFALIFWYFCIKTKVRIDLCPKTKLIIFFKL